MTGKTSVYVCADGTLTYGPYGGRDKIVPQALPIGIVDSPDEAESLILLIGRKAYDDPIADPRFEQQLNGRTIKPGYGPTWRHYCSLPEWERGNVETLFAVRKWVERYQATGEVR